MHFSWAKCTKDSMIALFMHVFNVFIKVKKTCFFMFFYLKINVLNIYGL